MKKIILILLCSLNLSCTDNTKTETGNTPPSYTFQWTPQSSGTQASLRGLSVVDTAVVWASGSQGTFLRTMDSGSSWKTGTLPDADTIDFRDIAAFDAQTAYILSAGTPALLYKTMDSGDTWVLQYENHTPGIFFDAFAFWDENHGLAMSDPVDGHFVLIRTTNGGDTWEEIPMSGIPMAEEGEAGFAGSGTGVAVQGQQLAWFATGGKSSRVFRSTDGGTNWQAVQVPLVQGEASTGIFSLAFADSLHGIAVGGDYVQPTSAEKNAGFTTDGGITWQLADTPPAGYRSGAAYAPALQLYMSVGTTGSDYSADGGKHWSATDTVGYHAIQFAPDAAVGFAAGGDGTIAKVRVMKNK